MSDKDQQVKVPHFYLIEDALREDSGPMCGSVGFGAAFNYKGRLCRVAVRVKNSGTMKDFKQAWNLLKAAVDNPEAPESKAAFNDAILRGNEMTAWN